VNVVCFTFTSQINEKGAAAAVICKGIAVCVNFGERPLANLEQPGRTGHLSGRFVQSKIASGFAERTGKFPTGQRKRRMN
jgi:hypothetical protein